MTTLKKLNTPVFAAEGILHIKHDEFALTIGGSVRKTHCLSLDDIKNKLKNTTVNRRLTSVSGWSVRANWCGVLWKDFINYVEPLPSARYILASSSKDYSTAIWLPDLLESESILAWGVDGEPLEDEYGGPLRLVIPNLWGYKSCKWVSRIDFVEKYQTGYWELRGYSHRGQIEPGETLDVNSQSWRPISGGEVTEF